MRATLKVRIAVDLLLLAGCAGFGGAQTAVAGPSFDVASIQPSAPPNLGGGRNQVLYAGCRGGPGSGDPGRWTCQNVSLANLVTNAYDIKTYQLTAPSWMNDERFDITATIPAGTTAEQMLGMEQNLLAHRFGLVVHHDKKELPAYVLTAPNGDGKLQKSAPEDPAAASAGDAAPPLPPAGPPKLGPDGFPVMPAGRGAPAGAMMMMMSPSGLRLQMPGITMDMLAGNIARMLGEPVTDGTGLKAKYDVKLTFSGEGLATMPGPKGPPPGAMAGPPGPGGEAAPADTESVPLPVAIQEQLGLKLVHKKAMLDLIVVDHAEKTPTEN